MSEATAQRVAEFEQAVLAEAAKKGAVGLVGPAGPDILDVFIAWPSGDGDKVNGYSFLVTRVQVETIVDVTIIAAEFVRKADELVRGLATA